MKNGLARLTGISLCLAEIPVKRAVFFSHDSSSKVKKIGNDKKPNLDDNYTPMTMGILFICQYTKIIHSKDQTTETPVSVEESF